MAGVTHSVGSQCAPWQGLVKGACEYWPTYINTATVTSWRACFTFSFLLLPRWHNADFVLRSDASTLFFLNGFPRVGPRQTSTISRGAKSPQERERPKTKRFHPASI